MQQSTAPRLTRSLSSIRCGSSDPSLPQVPSCLWPTCAKRLQVHERGAMGGDQSPKPIKPVRQWDNQENKGKGRPPRPLYSAEPYIYVPEEQCPFSKGRPASCYPFPSIPRVPRSPFCRRPPSSHSPRSRDFDRRPPWQNWTSKGCGDWSRGKILETESGRITQRCWPIAGVGRFFSCF